MNLLLKLLPAVFLMALVSISYAQTTGSSTQSAKEQRQSSASKDKARPDRSKAEAAKLRGAQKEAKDKHDQNMRAAETDMAMGVASVSGQTGARSGANKKGTVAPKDAVKKPALDGK